MMLNRILVKATFEVAISLHRITLPLRMLLTGVINSLVTSGKLYRFEILENLNVVALTWTCNVRLVGELYEIPNAFPNRLELH